MKRGRRFVSFLLAMVMVCSLMVSAGAAEAQEEISAYLSYDITVMYNGEAQTMTDAAGNTVYPVSYNGSTYLPVRAVSNMLGVAVDWDGATQTVILSDSTDGRTVAENGGAASTASGQEEIKAYLAPGITVKYNGEIQTMTDTAGNIVYPVSYNGTTYLPVRAVSNMLGVSVDWDGTTQTVLLRKLVGDTPNVNNSTNKKKDVFNGEKTSADAMVLGENHIGYEWAEIDWSTASDSYIRVKFNKPSDFSTTAQCVVRWEKDGKAVWYGEGGASVSFDLFENEWTNIPLTGGSTEYVVRIDLSFQSCTHYMSDEEKNLKANGPWHLTARFNAEITNPNNRWLLSTYRIDWEHAPLTCEKALEITKDCKTDAEKITAVFNWVSQNIKYDKKLSDDIEKNATTKTATHLPMRDEFDSDEEYWLAAFGCEYDPVKGAHTLPPAPLPDEEVELLGYTDQGHLNLDYILTHKTGVCAHYTALMTGMLRSLGIPCKYVSGRMYTGQTIKGYNDKFPGWVNHAWVAVNPETGTLNKSALGAGADYSELVFGKESEPTGWIRLDPTNAHDKTYTSNDKNYDTVANR